MCLVFSKHFQDDHFGCHLKQRTGKIKSWLAEQLVIKLIERDIKIWKWNLKAHRKEMKIKKYYEERESLEWWVTETPISFNYATFVNGTFVKA